MSKINFETISGGVRNLTFTYNYIKYKWEGGFGSVISSEERGLKEGEIRNIGGILFSVFRIDKRFLKKPIILWTTVDRIDAEDLRELKKQIFS